MNILVKSIFIALFQIGKWEIHQNENGDLNGYNHEGVPLHFRFRDILYFTFSLLVEMR